MKAPPSVVGSLAQAAPLARFRNRAILFVVLIALAVISAFVPERYRAAVTLTPTDPSSLGLSGALGQLGAVTNVFGSQAAVEVALRVGGSVSVREAVIKRTKLADRLDEDDLIELHRWLADRIVIRSLRGGIVLIEIKLTDAKLGRDLVAAYAEEIRQRLSVISRLQTAYKRDVLEKLVVESGERLELAQARYDRFRLGQRIPLPETSLPTVNQRILQLESAIRAKQIARKVALTLFAPGNQAIVQIDTEMNALQRELGQVRATSPSGDPNLGQVVRNSSQLFRLERELNIAKGLYDSYMRFLQGTSVEDLTSTANVRVLEPPFIDTERQLWWPGASFAIFLAVLWAAIEFYRLRPPPSSRTIEA